MKRVLKVISLAGIVLFLLAFFAWIALPRIVDALPGDIRSRLPDQLIAIVTTPLPTALPGPLSSAGAIGPDEFLLPTRTPTATSTTSPVVTRSLVARASATPTRNDQPPSPTLRPSPTVTPTPSSTPGPSFVVLEGLKVVPQKYNNCGPANLSVMLDYYGYEINQLEIGQALKPNYEDRNVSPTELAGFVQGETDLKV